MAVRIICCFPSLLWPVRLEMIRYILKTTSTTGATTGAYGKMAAQKLWDLTSNETLMIPFRTSSAYVLRIYSSHKKAIAGCSRVALIVIETLASFQLQDPEAKNDPID